MKELEINDGYLHIPDEWIIINNRCPQDSHYVGVVEIRNGEAYNAPHFVFFSVKPIIELTAAEESVIIDCCIDTYPALAGILDQHVPLQFHKNGKIMNGVEWLRSPLAGCFVLPECDSISSFLYDAMIIRTPHGGSR